MLDLMDRTAAPGSKGQSERELLGRARLGEREAFDRLVGLHLPRVWRIVWRILRHQEDTEDVVQEVFLKAYESLPRFRGEAALSTWLHRIAVTTSLNHVQRSAEKLRRATRPLSAVAGDGEASPGGVADALVSKTPSPLQSLEAGELARRLAECLSRIPANWRVVIALRDGESLSYEEISRALDLKLGTVRSRLARARLALRECVEGGAS
jgi:RNA polymerase sigma-70 factor (ECF subfamily)